MGWVTKLVNTKPVAKSELDLAIEDVKKVMSYLLTM